LALVSSGIFGSFCTMRTDNYSAAGVLITQRNSKSVVEAKSLGGLASAARCHSIA
jgi:hypothetical protein